VMCVRVWVSRACVSVPYNYNNVLWHKNKKKRNESLQMSYERPFSRGIWPSRLPGYKVDFFAITEESYSYSHFFT